MFTNRLAVLITSFVILIYMVGCGKKEPDIVLKQPDFKKYPFKSAVVEYTYSGDASGKMMQYIDYWGAREVNEDQSILKIMGQQKKNNTLTIFDQDSLYSIDLDKNEGTRMKNPNWEPMIAQYKGMTAEQKKNFIQESLKQYAAQAGAKMSGTEEVLGRKCDRYEGQGFNQCLWNGVLMKMDVDMNGMKVNMIASKFETDIDIPSAKFTPPASVKWKSIDPHGMMGAPQSQDQHAGSGDQNAQQAPQGQSDPHEGMDMKKDDKKTK